MSKNRVAFVAALLAFSAPGCRGADRPRTPPVAPVTIDVARPDVSLRAVASDGAFVVAAFAPATADAVIAEGSRSEASIVELRRGDIVAWSATLEGRVGVVALDAQSTTAPPIGADALRGCCPVMSAGPPTPSTAPTSATPTATTIPVYATLRGAGSLAGVTVRGEPASAVVALDRSTGAVLWRVALESNDWVTIAALAPMPDRGVLVVGSYADSLRAGASVVSAGGQSDGFILALSPTGTVSWLRRMGGSGTDAVQAVAVRGTGSAQRIAIAGTYQNTAEIGGVELPAFDERTPNPDGYVAMLDGTGARLWAQTFGGQQLESVGGVAIDDDGRLVLAANVRGEVSVSGRALTAEGPGAGLVAWWNADGGPRIAELIDGDGFDSLWGITAIGSEVVVGGELDGTPYLGAWNAGAKEVARIPVEDPSAHLVALGGVPGGFIAAVSLPTAAKILIRPIPRDAL